MKIHIQAMYPVDSLTVLYVCKVGMGFSNTSLYLEKNDHVKSCEMADSHRRKKRIQPVVE